MNRILEFLGGVSRDGFEEYKKKAFSDNDILVKRLADFGGRCGEIDQSLEELREGTVKALIERNRDISNSLNNLTEKVIEFEKILIRMQEESEKDFQQIHKIIEEIESKLSPNNPTIPSPTPTPTPESTHTPTTPSTPNNPNYEYFRTRLVDPFMSVPNSSENRYFIGYSNTDDIRERESVQLPEFLPVWGIVAKKSNREPFKFDGFEQIEIKESIVVESYQKNGLTYYVRPKHEYDESTLAYDLDTFPDITIPKNKILFNHCNFDKWRDSGLLLRKGSTFVNKDNSVGSDKKSVFIGDQWLTNLGMPRAYADIVEYKGVQMERSAAFNLWCKDVNTDDLFREFQNAFAAHGGDAHVIWNAEGSVKNWTVERHKIERCFIWWHEQKFKAKLSSWNQSPYRLTQIMWNGNPKLINWDNLPHQDSSMGLSFWNSGFHRSLDIWEIGDYFNRFDSGNYIHRILCEYFLNDWARNHIGRPEIKIIPTFFSDMEHNVDQYMEGNYINRVGRDGIKYTTDVKASVLPHMMFNMAAWSIAVMDGIGKWDDPFLYLSDKTDEYGVGWSQQLGDNYELFKQGAYFQYRNRKGDNYFYWAIHSLSNYGNKEIIEDQSTKWIFPKMPDVVAREKSTLVAWKKSGNETLVLAMGHPTAGNSTRMETINIDGKDHEVVLNGQWVSIFRI